MSKNRWLTIYEKRTTDMVGLLRMCQATNDYSKINGFELIRIIETAVDEIKLLQDNNVKQLKNVEEEVLDNLCGEFLNYVLSNELSGAIEQFDQFIKENRNGSEKCMVRDPRS
jgi:hypothetical protein